MKNLLTLLACLGLFTANAQVITYSESFTNGVGYGPGSPQNDNWVAFRASLDTAVYDFTSITIKGSNDLTGKTCTDPANVAILATALKNSSTATSVTCGGVIWRVGDCGAGTELNANNLGTDCTCANPAYTMRVDLGSLQWGGVNTASCSPPSQTITVELTYAPPSGFQMAYGENTFEQRGYGMEQTSDGGYIMTGELRWVYGEGNGDVWLLKTDATGDTIWSQVYGMDCNEEGRAVRQTSDGGYIVVGDAQCYGIGGYDIFTIKTDANGDTLWTKLYGGTSSEGGNDIRQTSDGGYIIAAQTASYGPGSTSAYLIKINSTGAVTWAKTYGGSGSEQAQAVIQTSDGGYMMVGTTTSFGVSSNDFYAVKTNSSGDTLWTKAYGGLSGEYAYDVKQTSDGGYVIAGETNSFGSGGDAYVVRTDGNGDTLWTKYYGGAGTEECYAVEQTMDGGFAISGYTDEGAGSGDYYLIKTDANGDPSWVKTYGGSDWEDGAYAMQETADSGFALLGNTQSFGYTYFYLIKTNVDGESGECYERTISFTSGATASSATGVATAVGTGITTQNTTAIANNAPVEVNPISGTMALSLGSNPEILSQANGIAWVTPENGTSPYTYLWDDPSAQTTNAAASLSSGSYLVEVTDDDGCLDSSGIVIAQIGQQTIFQKSYGGFNAETIIEMNQTADGGYFMAGNTNSFGAGSQDAYIIKVDSLGAVDWSKAYGGTGSDYVLDAQQTSDGGYILAGYSFGFGLGVIDMYVVKTTSTGDTSWTKTYGGSGYELCEAVTQTADGGYAFLGRTDTWGQGGNSIFLVKTDASGDTLWTKVYGTTNSNYGYDVEQTTDGGYIIAGECVSCSGLGNSDIYVIKTDAAGDTLWTQLYGGASGEEAKEIRETADGGYIIIGETSSFGAGNLDSYVIKLDSTGTVSWSKTFGGISADKGRDIVITSDGGYIVTGESYNLGIGFYDMYTIRMLPNGDTLWTKNYGSTGGSDRAYTIVQTNDGGFAMAGNTGEFGIGSSGAYLVKTDIHGYSGECHDVSAPTSVSSPTTLQKNIATFVDNSSTTTGGPATDQANATTLVNVVQMSSSTSGTDATCFDNSDGTATAVPANGNAPYSYAWNDPGLSTTATSAGLQVGVYIVQITDDWGCMTWDTAAISEPDNIVITNTITNILCAGDSTGAIDITVVGGTLPYTYSWSNGETTEDIDTLLAATYTQNGVDAQGCSINDNFPVPEPMPLSVIMLTSDVLCNGGNSGNATSKASMGTPPYTYAWSNGPTSSTNPSLTMGTYHVTVTDNYGCVNIDSAVISEPLLLTTSTSKTDVTCNGLGDGTGSVTPSGGTTPFLYLWNVGQTDSTAVALFPGTYSVNVSDANSCIANGLVTITEPDALAVTSVVTNATCGNPNGTATATVTGGSSPYTYSWSSGGSSSAETGLLAATYTLDVDDVNACSITDTVVVSAPSTLTSSMVVTDVSCNSFTDGAADLTPAGGTPPYTYIWSGGETTEDISGKGAASYNVTITDNSGCANLVDVAVISEPAVLTSTVATTDASCNGGGDGTATISVSGGTMPYNYLWNTGQTTSTAGALFAGGYGVNVFDLNGCLTSNSALISEPNVMAISIGSSYVSCNSGSDGAADLTVSGGSGPFTYAWSNAATSEDIGSLVAGAYAVTVTDSCGTALVGSVLIDQPGALSLSSSTTDVSCNSGSNGAVDLTASNGVAPYTYAWSNSATTQDIANLVQGTYYVTVTDNCGLSKVDTAVVSEPATLTTSISKTNVLCNGASDGTATVTPSGGTSPYLYFWSNNQTTSTAVGLFPSNYTVNVIDFNGCLASNVISITEPTPINGTVVGSDATCNGGADGSANLSVSGGTTPYTYLWSNSDVTEDLSAAPAGSYTVTVTDSCGAIFNGMVSINEPAAMASSVVISDVTCNSNADGAADLSVSGGTQPYTYLWSTTESTEDIGSLDTGSYTVAITDACSAIKLDTAIVSEPAVLTTTMGQVDVSCYGGGNGTATVTPAGGTTPYNYLWSNGQITSTAVGLFPGSYTVNLTDMNGCLTTDIVTISQPLALTATIVSSTDVACNGGTTGSAVVNAGGGTPPYNYLWDDPGTQTDSNAVGLSAGIYTVLITDFCGANISSSVTISEPTAMTISTSKSDVSCNGYGDGSASVTAAGGTGPFTYLWSPSADTTSAISSLTPGTHYIMVTSACGSVLNDSAVIIEPTVLTTTMSSTNVSCNTGGNGTASVLAGGGVSPYNYLWSNGQSNSTAIGLFPGGYSVNITDMNGCLTSDVVTITEPAPMTASLSSTPVSCMVGNNGTATVVANAGTLPYTYNWSPSGGTAAVATNLAEDTYTVTLTDSCGATIIDSVIVGGPSSTNIGLVATQISCNGFNDGSIDLTVLNGTAPINYSWSNGDTTEDISGLSPGMYSVTVTDSCGTALSDSLLISEPTPLTTSISSTNATCNGLGDGTATVTVAGGTTPYNYTWNNGQFTPTSFALFPGNYSVNVIDFNGCLVTDLVTITEPTALSIAVAITDASCGESDGSADATVTGGVTPYVYAWSSGGSNSTDTSLAGGNYSLLVSDTNGCADSIDVVIPITAPVQEICIISVDSTSSKNVVVWEKPTATNIDSFRIYRDIVGVYTLVGTQAYGVESYFTDSTNGVNPMVTSYRYKVTTLDACGNESAMSDYHETMHMQVSNNGSTVDLLWDNYEGFNFNFYRILRDSTGLGGSNWQALDSVTSANFTFTDIDPPTIGADYVMEVVPNATCVATKTKNFNSSKSNTSSFGGPSNITANTTGTDASFGGCDGTATVTAAGGVEPYTYLWDGSAGFQATATAVGLCAGNYSVTVTDANGETLVTSQIVGETSGSTITATTTGTDANAGTCNGDATVTAVGGTPPYTYIWDGNTSSQTTQTATGLCPGTYSVNVFDSLGNYTTVFATVGELVGIDIIEGNLASLNINPNPFTNSTEISYTLTSAAMVRIEVFNLIGERISMLADEEQNKGEFMFTLSKAKEHLNAGVYIISLTINDEPITKRVIALD